ARAERPRRRPPLSARRRRAGRGRRGLVRRRPAAGRPGGARGGLRGGARTARRGHDGAAAHRRAQLRRPRPGAGRAAVAPGRTGRPDRPGRGHRRADRAGHRGDLPVRRLRPGDGRVHPRPRRSSPAGGGHPGRAGGPRRPARPAAPGPRRPARAGHPPAVVVTPDGRADLVDMPGGPPLGLGGLPVETASLRLPPGSCLALYTDGLVDGRDHDTGERTALLRRTLARSGTDPAAACEAVWEALLPEHPRDDVALLVARARTLDARHTAGWDVAQEPAAVSGVRAAVVRTLDDWGLSVLAPVTELI